jgi:hypothetical protein
MTSAKEGEREDVRKDPALGIERSGLRDVDNVLEGLAGGVVPKGGRSVVGCIRHKHYRRRQVGRTKTREIGRKKGERREWKGGEGKGLERGGRTSREHDALLVDGHGVNDGVVTGEVVDKGSLGAFPLFDAANQRGRPSASSLALRSKSTVKELSVLVPPSTPTRETVLHRMDRERPHALFVMRQGRHRLSCGEVPETDGRVHGAGDDLRVGFLAANRGDGAGVAGEGVDLGFGSHVPDLGWR